MNRRKIKGKIQPIRKIYAERWISKRRVQNRNKCPICGSNHSGIFFAGYYSKRSQKIHLKHDLDKSRPKQHPRREKRGQGKPR